MTTDLPCTYSDLSFKWVTWRDHTHFRDILSSRSSVGWDLLCSTHIIKFEMSTITCNEEMKGHAKCKRFRFEPPFGGLRGNVHGSSMARWKARARLPIGTNWIFLASSRVCGTIKRNLSKSAFSDKGGSLWAHISGRWGVGDVARNPSMDR